MNVYWQDSLSILHGISNKPLISFKQMSLYVLPIQLNLKVKLLLRCIVSKMYCKINNSKMYCKINDSKMYCKINDSKTYCKTNDSKMSCKINGILRWFDFWMVWIPVQTYSDKIIMLCSDVHYTHRHRRKVEWDRNSIYFPTLHPSL